MIPNSNIFEDTQSYLHLKLKRRHTINILNKVKKYYHSDLREKRFYSFTNPSILPFYVWRIAYLLAYLLQTALHSIFRERNVFKVMHIANKKVIWLLHLRWSWIRFSIKFNVCSFLFHHEFHFLVSYLSYTCIYVPNDCNIRAIFMFYVCKFCNCSV